MAAKSRSANEKRPVVKGKYKQYKKYKFYYNDKREK